jgi:GTPase SAR1 family protein
MLIQRFLINVYLIIARKDQGSELIISLYDFGGQDIFNVLHHFFMSKFGVYIVVFDMELFLSKAEEKRESCMKHLKFWMNSVVMHTYDEKSGKTAPVAIVGSRKDVICSNEDQERISRFLKVTFYLSVAWKSLLTDESSGLCFFPVNNVEQSDRTVTRLLEVCQSFLENADFVKEKVPFVWLKIFDEIRERQESFLAVNVINEMCSKRSFSSEDVKNLLTFFNHMGILIWINEEKLRDIVILDPIEYFVKPATMVVCKHIATTDDPYHIVHCEEIHKACRKHCPEGWYQMLEFGLISEDLMKELLRSACTDESHVDNVLLLMERYGISSSFLYLPQTDGCKRPAVLFLPSVAPSDPDGYFVDEQLFDDFSDFMAYDNLVGRLRTKREDCFLNFDEYVVFHFAFSVSVESLQHTLLSTSVFSSTGFLPNGLFERFIGRVCGILISTVMDVSAFLERNNFIGFKDVVKLKFMFRDVRITNLLENNMIRIEVERNSQDVEDKEMILFIHDCLFEMVQAIIRECYKNLMVVTVLPVDQQDYRRYPLLPLSELRSVAMGKMRNINYHTEDGKQRLSIRVEDLRRLFDVWLDVPTIHPKKGEYVNKVTKFHFVSAFIVILSTSFLVGDRKSVFCFPFSRLGTR